MNSEMNFNYTSLETDLFLVCFMLHNFLRDIHAWHDSDFGDGNSSQKNETREVRILTLQSLLIMAVQIQFSFNVSHAYGSTFAE